LVFEILDVDFLRSMLMRFDGSTSLARLAERPEKMWGRWETSPQPARYLSGGWVDEIRYLRWVYEGIFDWREQLLMLNRAGLSNLPLIRTNMEALAGALASRATDSLRVSVVSALPESPFNLAKVAGTALTGRDWSSDFARLQNIDVALSSRASESTLMLIRNLIMDVDMGLSGYDAAYPRHDDFQWRDSITYTVTETTWTEKTRLSYRPRSTRGAGYFIRFAIWGYVSAPGQTMYVRVRSGFRGVLGTVTFTETSPALREIRAYYQKALWWDDPFVFEARVGGAGQTGYITYVDANFIPVEGLAHGILTDLSDLRALRVDADGLLLQGLNKVGGVALTGRDWSSDFARLQNLDVLLSSRASEATLAGIRAQTDKLTFDTSNRLKVNVEVTANPPNLDVPLSSFTGVPDQSPPGRGVVLLGFDGTYVRMVRVTSDGRLLATLG
jgi:hypothetical protein